jgi:hypothetical protein
VSFTDQEAACFLCGSTQDPCGCQDLALPSELSRHAVQRIAEWHELSQYHGGDADELRACEACDRYAEERPEDLEHENGMHAGAHVEGCGACDSRGV